MRDRPLESLQQWLSFDEDFADLKRPKASTLPASLRALEARLDQPAARGDSI